MQQQMSMPLKEFASTFLATGAGIFEIIFTRAMRKN